ncbi:MAG TPA: hypothetical protein VKU88_08745 [Acidimicrobiales bacterium]|nr:hypothetical protein [Acidimicrobiales bacterium]
MLEVGRVVKPHGLAGRVVVELWTNRPERSAPGARLFAAERPLQVSSATLLAEEPGRSRYLVSFVGVDGREAAEALRGAVLCAEPIDVDGALWVHEMIGAGLFDDRGCLVGRVEAVEANPASDLLILSDGRVVPLTFVRRDAGRLVVSGPPGLLDAG